MLFEGERARRGRGEGRRAQGGQGASVRACEYGGREYEYEYERE